jgi:hypothetical protein
MNPPRDGDDVAKVTPLRRREPHLVGLPKLRDPLPAERAAFDPELEPADVQLRRTRRRQARNRLGLAARRLRPRLSVHRRRPGLVIALAIGCAATAGAAALIDGAGSVTHPQRTTASSTLKARKPSASKVSVAEAPARRVHQPGRRAVHQVVHHQAAQSSTRHKPRFHPSARASTSAAATEPTETTATPAAAPPTPVVNSGASTQSAEASQSSSSSTKPPAGPTGSGAAFRPGY